MIPNLEGVQGLVDDLRGAMGSDTATLLLLDESSNALEPGASAGLGRLWRGATHVPVGAGFAGRIAAERVPVALDNVDETSVLNPILRDVGIRQLLGVPVTANGDLLGVLHVGWRSKRPLHPADTARLEGAASEIGQRLSERIKNDTHLAALTLQRSLLPAAPPPIEGLDIAVRYLPAEGDLGGDWYDIFRLPSGKVGFVMGDVEGHGLRAAVVMGRLRSALRAYALDHDDPAEVLHHLDRKLCHFETDVLATVTFAVGEPPFDALTVCSAGHPPPLIARPQEDHAEVADISTGLVLGLDATYPRASDELSLAPDHSVAFYTDGLVERRPRFAGEPADATDRTPMAQRAFVSGYDAETACTRMIASTLGDDPVEDDVALVVIRRPAHDLHPPRPDSPTP